MTDRANLDLPAIPLIEAGADDPLAPLAVARDKLDDLIDDARRRYTGPLMRIADKVSRRWLVRVANPYLAEIDAVAARVDHPGVYMLNMSFEWTCTAGVWSDPHGAGSRLLRTLDWPQDGLGRNLVVTRQHGDAGPYYNVTWPGFVGVLTAMAPGRFSISINQPPAFKRSPFLWFDWLISRISLWGNGALPPVHLLRRVFDECASYDEARKMIAETPLCMPAFFTLSGVEDHEGCVIERAETRAAIEEAPASIANHWRRLNVPGHERGWQSAERWRTMDRTRESIIDGFDWVVPPIMNPTTRLAVIANARQEKLEVVGIEHERFATQIFTL